MSSTNNAKAGPTPRFSLAAKKPKVLDMAAVEQFSNASASHSTAPEEVIVKAPTSPEKSEVAPVATAAIPAAERVATAIESSPKLVAPAGKYDGKKSTSYVYRRSESEKVITDELLAQSTYKSIQGMYEAFIQEGLDRLELTLKNNKQ